LHAVTHIFENLRDHGLAFGPDQEVSEAPTLRFGQAHRGRRPLVPRPYRFATKTRRAQAALHQADFHLDLETSKANDFGFARSSSKGHINQAHIARFGFMSPNPVSSLPRRYATEFSATLWFASFRGPSNADSFITATHAAQAKGGEAVPGSVWNTA
jgi:hypothetical protein